MGNSETPWAAADVIYEKACDAYNAAVEIHRGTARRLRDAEKNHADATDEMEDAERNLHAAEKAASRGVGGVFAGARREQSDAKFALDLEATRRDVLRAYLSDLESNTRELAALHPQDSYYGGQAEMLAAVASFIDGQQDGSVTRG